MLPLYEALDAEFFGKMPVRTPLRFFSTAVVSDSGRDPAVGVAYKVEATFRVDLQAPAGELARLAVLGEAREIIGRQVYGSFAGELHDLRADLRAELGLLPSDPIVQRVERLLSLIAGEDPPA